MAKQILESDDPVTAKAFGRKIHNFKIDEWKDARDQYMQFGIRAKFDQNEALATFLKSTGDTTLVEASPYDNY